MENTTKALLIAASVLIVIVLIATGVLIIKNVKNTKEDIDKTGNSLTFATDSAVRDVQKNYITKEEFNKFVDYFKQENRSSNEFLNIVSKQNAKIRNQIKITGYVYTGKINFNEIPTSILKSSNDCKSLEEYHQYMINEGFNILKKRGELELVTNTVYSHKEYYIKVYAKKSGYAEYDTLDEETKQKIEKDYTSDRNSKTVTSWGRWNWSYDEDGYINEVYYIAYLQFASNWVSKKDK